MVKERKILEERNADLAQGLTEEEEKSKHLVRLKTKHEATIAELEERMLKEQQKMQELDRAKRRTDTEMNDSKEQLAEYRAHVSQPRI